MRAITETRSGYVVAGILATLKIPTDTGGFKQLLTWVESFGKIIVIGIEGTGSYGAGLSSYLRRHGYRVVEAGCPDRRLRRMHGKSDTMDAENAARAALAGMATATPKTADGVVEMIRQLKIVHDTAVKDWSSAMVTLKALLVHGDDALRATTTGMSQIRLARHLAALRPTGVNNPADSLQFSLRSLARRWLGLDTEITTLERQINQLVRQRCPELLQRFGIGADTAAE